MAKKIVRVYLSTFVDVEMESDNFASDKEMKEYVKEYLSECVDDKQQLYDNLALEPTDIDVYDEDSL